jgi:hypothetical protein
MEDWDVLEEWKKNTKPFHTTIKDILEIPRGSTQKFICLDRNWNHTMQLNNYVKKKNNWKLIH